MYTAEEAHNTQQIEDFGYEIALCNSAVNLAAVLERKIF